MPLEDLDLEFEDEEDLKRKRNSETVAVDVDSLFANPGTPPESSAPKAAAPAAPAKPTIKSAPTPAAKPAGGVASAPSQSPRPGTPATGAEVKRLDEARAQMKKPAATAGPPSTASPPQPVSASVSSGANALDLGLDDGPMLSLSGEVEQIRFEARVQVAVAEFKAEFMADVLSDAKLLDHQVHQLLLRINQKHPELKPEVLAIKKLLADFAAKKRK